MNLKRKLRVAAFIISIGLFIIGLASCKLPASSGPETTQSSDGFPIPGNTATSGIDISVIATQTAQARPPVVVPTSEASQIPVPTIVIPAATDTPAEPTVTATAIAYVTATPGGPPTTYTLAAGEFAYCIARRFNVNLDELLALNNLTLESLLSPGLELKIPQTGNPFIGNRVLHDHPTTYKIQAGDTLNKIACYFGDLSPDMIATQNNLKSYTDLPVGEVLFIP